jgi:hypothetical protein
MKELRIRKSYLLATILLALSTVLKICSVLVIVAIPVHKHVLEHVIEKEELPHDMELKAMLKKPKNKTSQ